ncbi:uncharacterized protein LOC116620147 [Nematostella vectensis]|uniref:uncharacterized protein LOC116620147 n=1 Tax=Nematostella vectensis TaxID=45351 RepID=UPI00207768D7|nr:uncharacterized protein LOC116620147 [Nematostella vectensis]
MGFKRLFSMYPNLKDHFGEFKNIKIDEIDESQSHLRRVLTAMDNCVAALGDSVSFSAYAEELGRRHNRRNFRPRLMHLNAFRSCFISVVHEILAMAYLWDPEVEQAWNRLFDYITILMLRGIQLAEE